MMIFMVVVVVIVVVVVAAAAAAALVGAGTMQSVERLEYELEDQRIVIRFHRPIPGLAITELLSNGYQPEP
jgi:hypothetical protein